MSAAPVLENQIATSVETIGPEEAAKLLESSQGNRKLRPAALAEYARNLDHWVLNGETIKVDADGHLIDGHHRLTAIVNSGKSARFLVVRGVPKEAFATLDGGRARHFSDWANLAGEKNVLNLQSVLNVLFQARQAPDYWNFNFDANRGKTPSVTELIELLGEFPEVRESVLVGVASRTILSTGLGGALHFVFARKDKGMADRFFKGLAEGEDLNAASPVRALRERLIADKLAKRPVYRRRVKEMVIRAWNAVREGRELERIKIGSKKDSFPEIA